MNDRKSGSAAVKDRAKNVLNYKKPVFWIIVAVVVLGIITGICILTEPKAPEAAAPVPFLPRYEGIDWATADVYILDDEYYDDGEAYRSFSITIDRKNGLYQLYESPFSSFVGVGSYELSGDILTIRDSSTEEGRVNRFRMESGRLVWLADNSDNFTFVPLADRAVFSLSESELPTKQRMTQEDVLALAARGISLTWDDLLPYESVNISADGYLFRFPIAALERQWYLEVSDTKLTGKPARVLLQRADAGGEAQQGLDIRSEVFPSYAFVYFKNDALLIVESGGERVEPYEMLLTEQIWFSDMQGWIAADGLPTDFEMSEHESEIPTLTLGGQFAATCQNGARRPSGSGIRVYDREFNLLRSNWYGDTALNWLEPGIYYCTIDVFGPVGAFVEEANGFSQLTWRCAFRLIVTAEGPAPYAPGEAHDLKRATLTFQGTEYTVTEDEALEQLEGWLENAEEVGRSGGASFGDLLTLTREDGSQISLCPAQDGTPYVYANGLYYHIGDDAALFEMFGITVEKAG